MSEEEIIEIINNYVKALKKPNPFLYTNEQKANALQGLLDLYEKEKEKNKLVKTYKGNLPKNVELICLCKDDFERNINTDYIPKDKIREKIVEYREKIEKTEFYSLQTAMQHTISVLKLLLEENKSNENNI